jgi:hypothetical protein
MPRGSKPGERRGGRARGTPNKKTVLKDAVFYAAAAQPNTSPLDFMLGLMRDPKVPIDVRIDMAVSAAPFVHTRPKGAGPKPLERMAVTSRYEGPAEITIRRMDAKLSSAESGAAAGANLSPVDFLLGVMMDPEATPGQRIKAARVATRYKHTHPRPEEMPIIVEDPYGFSFDAAAAKALRDDNVRSFQLRQERGRRVRFREILPDPSPEEVKLQARIDERVKTLQCPAVSGYGHDECNRDQNRLRSLGGKRSWPPPNNILTEAEDAEEVHLMARVAAFPALPETLAWKRIHELDSKSRGAEALSAAERGELEELLKHHPALLETLVKSRLLELDIRSRRGTLSGAEQSEFDELRKHHPEHVYNEDEDDDPLARTRHALWEAVARANQESDRK